MGETADRDAPANPDAEIFVQPDQDGPEVEAQRQYERDGEVPALKEPKSDVPFGEQPEDGNTVLEDPEAYEPPQGLKEPKSDVPFGAANVGENRGPDENQSEQEASRDAGEAPPKTETASGPNRRGMFGRRA